VPLHFTVASAKHEPQSWSESDPAKQRSAIQRVIEDLYDIKRRLKDFVGLYNGVGAGATIRKHLHYHFFRPKPGHVKFPLQIAAAVAATTATSGAEFLRIERFYPLIAYRFSGENAVSLCVDRAAEWTHLLGDAASANIITIEEDQRTCLYFLPRHEFFSRSPGLFGEVGGCEVLGEFIFCSPAEDQAIYEQRVTYAYMWNILNAVRPPGVERLR
jgi:hypothetical protein